MRESRQSEGKRGVNEWVTDLLANGVVGGLVSYRTSSFAPCRSDEFGCTGDPELLFHQQLRVCHSPSLSEGSSGFVRKIGYPRSRGEYCAVCNSVKPVPCAPNEYFANGRSLSIGGSKVGSVLNRDSSSMVRHGSPGSLHPLDDRDILARMAALIACRVSAPSQTASLDR
jgi:hypothetical protein